MSDSLFTCLNLSTSEIDKRSSISANDSSGSLRVRSVTVGGEAGAAQSGRGTRGGFSYDRRRLPVAAYHAEYTPKNERPRANRRISQNCEDRGFESGLNHGSNSYLETLRCELDFDTKLEDRRTRERQCPLE